MRLRRMDASGDYVFGGGQADLYNNQPEAVAQSVLQRLNLWQGQWFYDTTLGMPWQWQVLGAGTQNTRDAVLRANVIQTPGVSGIVEYYSVMNKDSRTFAVAMTIDTVYGAAQLGVPVLPALPPVLPAAVPPPVVTPHHVIRRAPR